MNPQFNVRHLIVLVTAVGVLSGLIRYASLSPRPITTFFSMLAVWFSLYVMAAWFLRSLAAES